MNFKNFNLIKAISDARMTQAELVRAAELSSEARLSRIISGYVKPTSQEKSKIYQVLECSSKDLGFAVKEVAND